MILTCLILAAVLLYTEERITRFNLGTWFNGFGSLDSVCSGTSVQPMQYRVLIPWLYRYLPFPPSIYLYIFIKYLGMALALYGIGVFSLTLGIPWQFSVFLLCVILPITFFFDYVDCYYEFAFFCLAWSLGQQHVSMLCVIALLASLNRETGVFVPLGCYLLGLGAWQSISVLICSLCGLAIPRLVYGKRPRYCSLSQVKENIKVIKSGKCIVEYLWALAIFIAYGIVGIIAHPSGGLMNLYWLMGVFGLLMLIPSRWNEVRVFVPMLAVLIPILWFI